MAHKLYLIGVGDSQIFALKAIRDALETLASDVPSPLKAAMDLLKECQQNGYAFVGQAENELHVQDALAALTRQEAAFGVIDPDEAELASYRKEPEPKSEAMDELSKVEADPKYAPALIFMSMTEGNPLKAFAHAHSLSRVSDVPEHYYEIMATLLVTFPWILDMAKISGVLIDWKDDE